MNVQLINPFLEAMVNVMTTMARMEPSIGKPCLKEGETACGDVTGFMEMSGPVARGSFAITFSQAVISELVKRMLGENLPNQEEMERDMAGEMANMVVGGAKNAFAEKGYNFDMSTPNILYGKDHTIHHKYKGQTILLPCTADAGEFYFEICFEE